MIKRIYSVRDSKGSFFGSPIFCDTEEIAVRSFNDARTSGDTLMALHPADFVLYYLGDFDCVAGTIRAEALPVAVATPMPRITAPSEDK